MCLNAKCLRLFKNVLKYGSETDMLLQLGLPSINAATVLQLIVSVSYTHLTLPTILRV